MEKTKEEAKRKWEESAEAWIKSQNGEEGDYLRKWVLDTAILNALPPPILSPSPTSILDVGCGEGRFCRKLSQMGYKTTGIDLTSQLIDFANAKNQQNEVEYHIGDVTSLPFPSSSFDIILSLIDFASLTKSMDEIDRVLKQNGIFLFTILHPIITSHQISAWVKDENGRKLHVRVDDYLMEKSSKEKFNGVEIVNYHRPLRDYMNECLKRGYVLEVFDEPEPLPDAPFRDEYLRVPWALVMRWRKL